jgi:hypothetical protein
MPTQLLLHVTKEFSPVKVPGNNNEKHDDESGVEPVPGPSQYGASEQVGDDDMAIITEEVEEPAEKYPVTIVHATCYIFYIFTVDGIKVSLQIPPVRVFHSTMFAFYSHVVKLNAVNKP